MTGFPFTFGSDNYSASDFDSPEYKKNLGRFLFSAIKANAEKYQATSTTNWDMEAENTVTAVNKTFTIEAGKGFVIGMPVAILSVNSSGDVNHPEAGYGYVFSYSGTTLVVCVLTQWRGSEGQTTPWLIGYASPTTYSAFATLPIPYGTGRITLSEARAFMGGKGPGCPEVIEDFTGYRDDAISVTPASQSRMFTKCLGGGNIKFGAQVAGLESIPSLDQHPGLARLSVASIGDLAFISLSDYGQTPFGNMDLSRAEFMVYVPTFNTSSDTVNKFRLQLGWMQSWGISSTLSAYLDAVTDYIPDAVSVIHPNTNVGLPYLYNWSGRMADESITFVTQDGVATPAVSSPVNGKWYRVTLVCDLADCFFTITSTDPAKPYSCTTSIPLPAGMATEGNCGTPFILLTKLSGSRERVVYIDYMAFTAPDNLIRY